MLGGGRSWEFLLNGCRVSVGGDKNVLQMDSGDGWHIVNVLNATELYILKWLKW